MSTLPVEGTLGDRLKAAREYRGMYQTQLAKAVGATAKQTVSQWETGVRNPSLDNLKALELALNVPLSYLVEGKPFDPESMNRMNVIASNARLEVRLGQLVERLDNQQILIERLLHEVEQVKKVLKRSGVTIPSNGR